MHLIFYILVKEKNISLNMRKSKIRSEMHSGSRYNSQGSQKAVQYHPGGCELIYWS